MTINPTTQPEGERMAQFTPGPWRVEEGITSAFYLMADGDDGFDCIAAETEGEANARLIAAAPELYEAVAAFVERWNDNDSRADTDYVASLMLNAHRKARGDKA